MSDMAVMHGNAGTSSKNEPKLLYYDAAGKRVDEGSAAAVKQFLSDDPNRPDAPKEEKDESGAKPIGNSGGGAAPVLYYYDAAGKRVPEGDVSAVKQYGADDPSRPDVDAEPDDDGAPAPANGNALDKMSVAELKDEAEARGLPKGGKKDQLIKAIQEHDAAAAADAGDDDASDAGDDDADDDGEDE